MPSTARGNPSGTMISESRPPGRGQDAARGWRGTSAACATHAFCAAPARSPRNSENIDDRAHGHGQELQRIASRRRVPGGDAGDRKVERLDREHRAHAGREDSEPLVQRDAMRGDEPRLRVVQREPRAWR